MSPLHLHVGWSLTALIGIAGCSDPEAYNLVAEVDDPVQIPGCYVTQQGVHVLTIGAAGELSDPSGRQLSNARQERRVVTISPPVAIDEARGAVVLKQSAPTQNLYIAVRGRPVINLESAQTGAQLVVYQQDCPQQRSGS